MLARGTSWCFARWDCGLANPNMSGIRRRDVLKGTALALVGTGAARGGVISQEVPWTPDESNPPQPVRPGPWVFFTAAEAATVEALVDRIIPPDPNTPGGK